MRSISNGSMAASAQASARSRIRSASVSRRSGASCLLSRRPRIGRSGDRITAPANTGPKSAPRPTSSTPAIRRYPCERASRSYLAWHLTVLDTERFERARAALVALAQTCGFAPQAPQVIQFCTANAAGPHHVDVVDYGRVHREDALDAVTEAHLAYRNGFTHASILAGNHRALE